VRDLVDFDGVRGNDLVGYGLVVGLDGSGDSLRNSPFTEEILSNVLERLGVNVTGEQLRSRNVAAVFVTGELRPFARAGSRIDLTVSAMGDARSLLGGTLVMTPLKAADGLIYAVGQGTVIAGGARAEGEAAEVVEGVPTSGAIPSGARVEREVPFVFNDMHSIRLALRNPDFTTAERIERAINDSYGARVSQMLDSGTVLLNVRATREPTPAHAIGPDREPDGPAPVAGARGGRPALRHDRPRRGRPNLPRRRLARRPRAPRGRAARGRPAESLRTGRDGGRAPHRGRTG
jgi:flagellar P-ring protein FlgI